MKKRLRNSCVMIAGPLGGTDCSPSSPTIKMTDKLQTLQISRLADHYPLIVAKIEQGKTLTMIAKELTEMGCITSRQNLSVWLERRKKRLERLNEKYLAIKPLPTPDVPQAEKEPLPTLPNIKAALEQLIEKVSKEPTFGKF